MRLSNRLLIASAAAGTASAVAVSVKHRQFRALAAREARTVFSEAKASLGPDQLNARLATLPEPVQRHLPTPSARTRRPSGWRASGTTAPSARRRMQRWSPIEGEQYFSAWLARLRLVRAACTSRRCCGSRRAIGSCHGRGNMLVKPLSAFTIADASGPEIDQGSALRWLAESRVVSLRPRRRRCSMGADRRAIGARVAATATGCRCRRSSRSTRRDGSCSCTRSAIAMWAAAVRCSTPGPAATATTSSSAAFACLRRWRSHGTCRRPVQLCALPITALEYNVAEPF